MKSKIDAVVISFILIVLLKICSLTIFWDFGLEAGHSGLLFSLGLLFGPYGALGAALGNLVNNLLFYESPSISAIYSFVFSFGVSYLAYKLWYSGFKTTKITKPNLNTTYHLALFLSIIIICGLIYSVMKGTITLTMYYTNINAYPYANIETFVYFLNFVNSAFIYGIIGIWISKKKDIITIPKISKKSANKKLYKILFYLLIISTITTLLCLIFKMDMMILLGEITLTGIILLCYLTKPFKHKIEATDENTITEKIIHNFLIVTLAIAIIGVVISIFTSNLIDIHNNSNIFILLMPGLIITDIILIAFFIPGLLSLRYFEKKVLKPITSFSEIERFIKENEKIESEGLVEIYSEYINEKNEIGTLARSYTELINHNNYYIENIHTIEGEKERINAELNIATRIQEATLPTEKIENDDFAVTGYSHPAREVGGDFFDYYMLDDDNLAIAIGDASGKGVPAALLTMISHVIIKQMLKHEKDPSKVLSILNNQLIENNSESMFITLLLGIYNKKTKKLIFSNAGHTPPLIKENDEYKYLNIDSGIVLGIVEDFEYNINEIDLTDEIILYTDGITDANNEYEEMYGEERLLNFFNEFKSDEEPITPLLKDIHNFTKDAEQYDDMTLLCLKIK